MKSSCTVYSVHLSSCCATAGHAFSGHYDEYFGLNTDTESIVYVMLANHMLHTYYPFIITVAEVFEIIRQIKTFIDNNIYKYILLKAAE